MRIRSAKINGTWYRLRYIFTKETTGEQVYVFDTDELEGPFGNHAYPHQFEDTALFHKPDIEGFIMIRPAGWKAPL